MRDDGTTQTTLGCSSSPCSDTTVTNGTYTYHVTSLYGDTWTSPAADSNLIMVQNQQNTTTTLASSDNPSVVGEQVTCTATVSTGTGTPTGTVTFKDGTGTISCASGSSSFNGTTATCKVTYSSLTGGSPHAITAVYSGDTNYLGSTSNEVDQAVGKASTTTAVSSNHNPSVTGQSVTYTATILISSPGAGTVGGTVNFQDGGGTISGCGTQTVTSGQATCTVTGGYAASGGSHTITAVYSGDTNFSGSTSPNLTQTVTGASTTTAVVSTTGSPSVTGQPVTYTATVSVTSPGAGTPHPAASRSWMAERRSALRRYTRLTPSGASRPADYLRRPRLAHDHGHLPVRLSPSRLRSFPTASRGSSTTAALCLRRTPSVTGRPATYTATVAVTSSAAGPRPAT